MPKPNPEDERWPSPQDLRALAMRLVAIAIFGVTLYTTLLWRGTPTIPSLEPLRNAILEWTGVAVLLVFAYGYFVGWPTLGRRKPDDDTSS